MANTNEVIEKGKLAKVASRIVNNKTTAQKNDALRMIAEQLHIDRAIILAENKKDIANGHEQNIGQNIIDRLLLTNERLDDMIDAIQQLITLEDPIGEILEQTIKENGLQITKKRVPLGVIGMIYEARPNVTVDAATLALKTNNAVILRGSSSAIHSNKALVTSIQHALKKADFPIHSVLLIEDTSRETAKALFTLNDYLDVLIPRGGKNLIDLVVRESTVPVLETGAGNCHIFIDESADYAMAESILLNAKCQRTSVCNASESLLMHTQFAQKYGKQLLDALQQHDVEIFGDARTIALNEAVQLATEDHYYEEFLRLAISVKIVDSVEEAITHIHTFGTKHSEAIITNDAQHAQQFLQEVDAAAVYHNASTRFTDGFEFGYGAEIGISTQKLHARGPMGLPALTSTKFFIAGNGQIRQ